MYQCLVVAAFCLQVFSLTLLPAVEEQILRTQEIQEQTRLLLLQKLPASIYQIQMEPKSSQVVEVLKQPLMKKQVIFLQNTPLFLSRLTKKNTAAQKVFLVDMGFAYKSLKKTVIELPPEMIYTAMEIDVPEGFELEENISSMLFLGSGWSLLGRLIVKESWMEKEREENLLLQSPDLSSSLKPCLGFVWKKSLQKDTHVVVEAFLQQKTEQIWNWENAIPVPSFVSELIWDGFFLSVKIIF